MNHQALSPSQFRDLFPGPPDLSAAWKPFTMHVVDGPLHGEMSLADNVLGLHTSGKHHVRQEVDHRAREANCVPGEMTLVPSHRVFRFDATAPARFINLFLPDAFLHRVMAEHWGADPGKVEVLWQPFTRDRVIESLMTALAREASNGSPSGRLYAETGCEFLAHHVIHCYSSLSAAPPRFSGGLPGNRLKLVQDYIEANLAEPLSLHVLAGLSGVSARHFERAFRQATGEAPHAYVLRIRVLAARDLLLSERNLTVEEISARSGFSSASHLALAFRRHIGCSPSEFRRHSFD